MKKSKLFKHFNFSKYRKIFFRCFIIVLVSIFILLCGKAYYDYRISQIELNINNILNKKIENISSCSPVNNDTCVRRAIDGVFVKPELANIYPLAVIIDNHPDSRPPSSLAKASLVYEAETEAGITRYLAIYAGGDNLKEIGPVRSARPYFVDWSKELQAVMIHCGGSPAALAKLTYNKMLDLNEFYQGAYFWRDENKTAPHNVYTSWASLSQYLEKNNLTKGDFESWKFKDDAPDDGRPLNSEVDVSYKISGYLVKWKYDSRKNDYLRYLDGEIHHDQDGKVIRAKNIIIEFIGESY